MRVSYLNKLVKKWKKSDEVFCAYFEKTQADDMVELYYDDEKPLTKKEWQKIVHHLLDDEQMWNEINNSFQFAVDRIVNKRKGNNGNH